VVGRAWFAGIGKSRGLRGEEREVGEKKLEDSDYVGGKGGTGLGGAGLEGLEGLAEGQVRVGWLRG
jgi:hypothetical protein